MTLDPQHGLHPSREARYIFGYLHKRGGSMRIGPLLRSLRLDPHIVIAATNELAERYWITVIWRKAAPSPADEETRPLRDVYRLCTTRFGRRKYRTSWPVN